MKLRPGQTYTIYTGWRTWPHSESSQISGGADGEPFHISLIEPPEEPEEILIPAEDVTPEVVVAAANKFDVEPSVEKVEPKVIIPYTADF